MLQQPLNDAFRRSAVAQFGKQDDGIGGIAYFGVQYPAAHIAGFMLLMKMKRPLPIKAMLTPFTYSKIQLFRFPSVDKFYLIVVLLPIIIKPQENSL